MIAYIKGKLEMKMTEYVVIDVGGIGYKVFMSELGIENIGNIGDTVKVHTYYRVREDDISIFGVFLVMSKQRRKLKILLKSVQLQ